MDSVPAQVTAGETLTVHIELASAPATTGSVILWAFGPDDAQISGQVSTDPSRTSYDVSLRVPADAPGGIWTIAQLVIASTSGMHNGRIPIEKKQFTVVQSHQFTIPTAAKISLNLTQVQLLRTAAFKLQDKVETLRASLRALAGSSQEVQVNRLLVESAEAAERDVERTADSFLSLATNNDQAQKRASAIFFKDIVRNYADALVGIKAGSRARETPSGINLKQSERPGAYSVQAQAVLRAFEFNEAAYTVVANAGSVFFDLEVRTFPTGATVSYGLAGDSSMETISDSTNTTIKNLAYATWEIRLAKSDCKPEQREYEPFHDTNHVVSVELQCNSSVKK